MPRFPICSRLQDKSFTTLISRSRRPLLSSPSLFQDRPYTRVYVDLLRELLCGVECRNPASRLSSAAPFSY